MTNLEALKELWHTEKCDTNCVKECFSCKKNKLYNQIKNDLITFNNYKKFILELKEYKNLPTTIATIIDEFKKLEKGADNGR